MSAVPFRPEPDLDDLEESPATQRAPASGLRHLIERTRPDAEDVTISRAPSVEAIARTAGAEDGNVMALMRELYARGDVDKALAIAAAIQAANPNDGGDGTEGGAEDDLFGDLFDADDALIVDDASIEKMVSAFREPDSAN